MKKKDRLKIAVSALESVERALVGTQVLIRAGNLSTAIVMLEHMQGRCKEIIKEVRG